MPLCLVMSMPVVAPSKATAVAPRLLVLWVQIAPGGMDACLLWLLRVVRDV
jgi:hypothetical protein